MLSFDYYAPTYVVFGSGREAEVGALVRRFGGTRVMLVYGGKSAKESGLIDRVEGYLREAGLACETYGGVQPNPRVAHMREGVRRALAFGADFLLGVGGGSAMDTAKAIAHGAANPELDIWDDIWMNPSCLKKSLPVGVISTLPASGSEMSDSAVTTNEELGTKRGLTTDLNRPKFAILNPELAATLPPYQVACGAVDILSHTLERYFNPENSNDLTDELAEGLMRTVIRHAAAAVAVPHDAHALSELTWCSSLSHNNLTGLGGVKDFAVHQFGQQLGASFDAAHGATLSVMWPCWARYCLSVDPARFARYGEKVWELAPTEDATEDGRRAIGITEEFFRSLHMPTCFTELGVGVQSEESLRALAHGVSRGGTRTIGKFRVLDEEDMLAIFRLANH